MTASDIVDNYERQCRDAAQELSGIVIAMCGLHFFGIMVFDKRTRFVPSTYNPPFTPTRDLPLHDAMTNLAETFVMFEDKAQATICYKGQLAAEIPRLLEEAGKLAQDTIFVTIPHTTKEEVENMDISFEQYIAGLGNSLKGILAVEELHADGTPHIHLIIKLAAPLKDHACIKEFFDRFIGTKDPNIQTVRTENKVVDYLLKTSTQPLYATGIYAQSKPPEKPKSGNDILLCLLDQAQQGIDPWTFLSSPDPKIRISALRNKKLLDPIFVEAKRRRGLMTIQAALPLKPIDPEHIKIWEWLVALKSRRIYEPTFAPRHLYISGRPNTRKSSFASYIQAAYRTFLTNVADSWWDGYADDHEVAIIDEFTIVDPAKGGKCLVTLNRFMESARGQPLPIKYGGVQKFNTTLPVIIISNLTKDAMRRQALKYFDESQIAAFERRFTFAEIVAAPLPRDFTFINLLNAKTDASVQYTALGTDRQQFVVILHMFASVAKLWITPVSESTARFFYEKYGILLAVNKYIGIPLCRGLPNPALDELTACIQKARFLPWVSYTLEKQRNGSFDFTYIDSELGNSYHESDGTASQANFIIDYCDIEVVLFGPDPLLITLQPCHQWFTTQCNLKLVYNLFRSTALHQRASNFTRFIGNVGSKFTIITRLSDDYACPICLSPADVATWVCGACVHPFHWSCLSSHIDSGHMDCPICRVPFEDFDDVHALCACDVCASEFRRNKLVISH